MGSGVENRMLEWGMWQLYNSFGIGIGIRFVFIFFLVSSAPLLFLSSVCHLYLSLIQCLQYVFILSAFTQTFDKHRYSAGLVNIAASGDN